MIKKIGLIILTAGILITLITGFNYVTKENDAELSVIEANRDFEIVKIEVEAELGIYRAKNAERIMEYDIAIGEIKQKIKNESDGSVRKRLETKLDGYEATHRQLKREIDNYKASGKENWDDFAASFSSRMDELGNS
jgi:hypothetical protein